MPGKRVTSQEDIDWLSANPPKNGESIRAWAARVIDQSDCPASSEGALRAMFYRVKKAAQLIHEKSGDKKVEFKYDAEKCEGTVNYVGPKPIYTVDDLLQVADIDLNKFAVKRIECNNWPTTMKGPDKKPIQVQNYQVKAVLEPRYGLNTDWKSFMAEINRECKKKRLTPDTAPGKSRALVVTCGDFHLGASVDNLVRTDKFDLNVLIQRMTDLAHHVNSMKASRVHVILLGDYIESWTGMNHQNVWKSLNLYGARAAITLHRVMVYFLQQVKNLASVRMVSGNHDRVTISKELDDVGEVGDLLAYMLTQTYGTEMIKYHPMVLSGEIDGIQYVQAHGHQQFTKGEVSKLLYEYGRQGRYNLFLRGHKHAQSIAKPTKSQVVSFADHEMVLHDEVDYRAYTVRPIFTGNFYSEQLGYTSSAGANLFWNNGKGKPHMMDLLL